MWHTHVERRIKAYTAMQSRSHYSYEDDDDGDVYNYDILFTLFLSGCLMIFLYYSYNEY